MIWEKPVFFFEQDLGTQRWGWSKPIRRISLKPPQLIGQDQACRREQHHICAIPSSAEDSIFAKGGVKPIRFISQGRLERLAQLNGGENKATWVVGIAPRLRPSFDLATCVTAKIWTRVLRVVPPPLCFCFWRQPWSNLCRDCCRFYVVFSSNAARTELLKYGGLI